MPQAKVNGINMYYEVHGEGPPLVLILGINMHHQSWRPILAPLKEKFQVIIFDNRGVGQTDAPDTPYSLDMMAEDTLQLLNHLKVQKAHFLGHSMGSEICIELSLKSPERMDKLVLSTPFVKLRPLIKFSYDLAEELFHEGIPSKKTFKLMSPLFFSNTFLSDPKNIAMLKELINNDPYPMSTSGFSGQKKAISNLDLSGHFPQITHESLVIGCEEDLCVPLEECKHIAQMIPNAKFATLEKTGHGCFTERPDAFLKLVLPFLLE